MQQYSLQQVPRFLHLSLLNTISVWSHTRTENWSFQSPIKGSTTVSPLTEYILTRVCWDFEKDMLRSAPGLFLEAVITCEITFYVPQIREPNISFFPENALSCLPFPACAFLNTTFTAFSENQKYTHAHRSHKHRQDTSLNPWTCLARWIVCASVWISGRTLYPFSREKLITWVWFGE